jgi:hypothetical protein
MGTEVHQISRHKREKEPVRQQDIATQTLSQPYLSDNRVYLLSASQQRPIHLSASYSLLGFEPERPPEQVVFHISSLLLGFHFESLCAWTAQVDISETGIVSKRRQARARSSFSVTASIPSCLNLVCSDPTSGIYAVPQALPVLEEPAPRNIPRPHLHGTHHHSSPPHWTSRRQSLPSASSSTSPGTFPSRSLTRLLSTARSEG